MMGVSHDHQYFLVGLFLFSPFSQNQLTSRRGSKKDERSLESASLKLYKYINNTLCTIFSLLFPKLYNKSNPTHSVNTVLFLHESIG